MWCVHMDTSVLLMKIPVLDILVLDIPVIYSYQYHDILSAKFRINKNNPFSDLYDGADVHEVDNFW
jgi:hypothetical protein